MPKSKKHCRRLQLVQRLREAALYVEAHRGS